MKKTSHIDCRSGYLESLLHVPYAQCFVAPFFTALPSVFPMLLPNQLAIMFTSVVFRAYPNRVRKYGRERGALWDMNLFIVKAA